MKLAILRATSKGRLNGPAYCCWVTAVSGSARRPDGGPWGSGVQASVTKRVVVVESADEGSQRRKATATTCGPWLSDE